MWSSMPISCGADFSRRDGKEELYDLNEDHKEVRNLAAEKPELAALLREKVHDYRAEE